jgi:hypothetical protein
VYAGGANGTIYAVNAQSGTLAYTTVPQRAGHSPNVGFGAAKNELFSETANGSLISYRTSQFGRFNSNHKTAAVLTTSPAVNDGTVYVGANDGGVYAFTTTGAPPTAARGIRLAAAALAAKQRHHAWPAWRSSRAPERDFVWNGQRSVPTHIEAVRLTTPALTDAPPTYHGGPVQTAPRSYLIFWNPGGNALEKRYGPSVVAALKRRASPAIAGAYTETGRLPNPLSDAVLQAEVARAIGTNHWTPNLNAQFVVLTPPGAIPARAGFCSYHSAFSIGRSAPAIYGVVPYSGALSACGPATIVEGTGDPAIDAALNNTVRLQHEFAIDPLLNGWHAANGGETGPGR